MRRDCGLIMWPFTSLTEVKTDGFNTCHFSLLQNKSCTCLYKCAYFSVLLFINIYIDIYIGNV